MENVRSKFSYEDILLKIRTGQIERQHGYGIIFNEFTPYLWGVVQHIIHDIEDEQVADIVGLVWVDIWKQIDTFDENRASFKTWASRIAHNKAVDFLRTRTSATIDDRPIEELVLSSKAAQIGESHIQVIIGQELQEIFLRELLKLDKVDIFLYLVKLNYDLSYKSLAEIARKADIELTEKAIQNRIYRTKEKIIEILQQKKVLD